jgi:hypothetical protein
VENPAARPTAIKRALCGSGLLCAVLLATFAADAEVASGARSAIVVGRSERIGGRSYSQWEKSAWQWDLAHLHRYPNPPSAGTQCVSAGQHGPVWFLRGDSYPGHAITRTCKIAAGRYLFIDVPTVECSTVEPAPYHAVTDAGLRRCVRSFRPATSSLELDGKAVKPTGFLVGTPVFSFTMPPAHNLLGVSGQTHGRAAADGHVIMLRPLARGAHTLVRTTAFAGGRPDRTTYRLTIG